MAYSAKAHAGHTTTIMSDRKLAEDTLVDRGGCPLCQSLSREPHHDFRDIPVHRCQDCGFIFSSRVMRPELLSSYYSDGFGSQKQLSGQRINASVNYLALKELIDLHAVKRILDVGAGYGFLVKRLCRHPWMQACGVEPSAQEAQYAHDQLGVEVRQSELSGAGYEKESFDVLICCEVIEHIIDPTAFVRKLAEYLRPGGTLMIMTDNFGAEVVKRMGAEWPKWIPHSHVSHFTGSSLLKCISDVGSLVIEHKFSYTPWENALRALRYHVKAPRMAQEVYSLSDVLEQEMSDSFRLFWPRFMLDTLWFRMSRRSDLSGSLMYVAASKQRAN